MFPPVNEGMAVKVGLKGAVPKLLPFNPPKPEPMPPAPPPNKLAPVETPEPLVGPKGTVVICGLIIDALNGFAVPVGCGRSPTPTVDDPPPLRLGSWGSIPPKGDGPPVPVNPVG
jgi:hypothetical protein